MTPQFRKYRVALAALALSLIATPAVFTPASAMEVGTNLNGVSHYSTSWVFTDMMKNAGAWRTANALSPDNPFETFQAASIQSDSNGWPKVVPFPGTDGNNHIVHLVWDAKTTINNADAGNPKGTYNITFKGKGKVEFLDDTNVWRSLDTTASTSPASTVYAFSAGHDTTATLRLRVSKSGDPADANNYIRDIQVIAPGYYNASTKAPTQLFQTAYLDSLAIYDGPLRFMDWGRTNDSTLSTTPTPATYYSQAITDTTKGVNGVAVEYMVAMANAADRDLWICIPHLAANTTYVTPVATYIKNNLNPNLKVWVEYSNEVWNSQFDQNKWASDQAAADPRYQNSAKWNWIYAEQAAKTWKLFRDVFGTQADTRVVRVLAGQGPGVSTVKGAYDALENTTLTPRPNPDGQFPEVLAPASYVYGHHKPVADNFDSLNWDGGSNNAFSNAAWSGNWTTSGTVTKIFASGSTTNRQAQITTSGSITRTANITSPANTFSVGVIWNTSGFVSGDVAKLEVASGPGQTFYPVATLTTSSSSDTPVLISPVTSITPSATTQVRVSLSGTNPNAKLVVKNVQVLGHPNATSLLGTFPAQLDSIGAQIADWTKFATQKNKVIYCYEGGQHYTLDTTVENDTVLVDAIIAMNRDAGIYNYYVSWLNRMHEVGVSGTTHYMDMQVFGKSGCFGAFETHYQTLDNRPKYKAIALWNSPAAYFHVDRVGSFANQDITPTAFTVVSPSELQLGSGTGGNTWKRVPYGYRITSKTRLKLDFKAPVKGELQGIGFATNNVQNNTRIYKLYGTDTWGTLGQQYTRTDGDWQALDFSVAAMAGANYYLVFINDHDVTSPTATCSFRNVQLYEGP